MDRFYRVRQFWYALTAVLHEDERERIREVLPAPLMSLFLRMQPSEQSHCFEVFHQLREQGETDSDLLTAALLHDVGKSRDPLNIVERVLIVLAQALFPQKVRLWGQSEPKGWKRPFVVAMQHPSWGAEMAAGAGASALVVKLIHHHQDRLENVGSGQACGQLSQRETELLRRLQLLDNES